jgi:hypothetical protein
MKHLIVTRCYFNDEIKFQHYFNIMKETFIPSVNNQSNKNFKIALICKEHHFDIIKNLINPLIELIRFNSTKDDYKEYVVEHNITIQTRHDCDDIMNYDYIEYIQKLYNDNIRLYDNFIITFQPTKYELLEKKEYTHGRDYSKVCSMFSTLIQKNVISGVFDVMHDHLKKLSKNVIYIKENYVKLVIHNNNTLSKLNPNDILIN